MKIFFTILNELLLKREKYKFIFFSLIKVLAYIFALLIPLVIADIINVFAYNDYLKHTDKLVDNFILLVVYFTFEVICWQWAQLYFTTLRDTVVSEVKTKLTNNYINKSYSYLISRNNSTDFDKITKASTAISELIWIYSYYLIQIFITIPFVFITIFLFNVSLGLILLFVFFLFVGSQFLLNSKIRFFYKKFLKNDADSFSSFIDSVNNIKTIKHLNIEKEVLEKISYKKNIVVDTIRKYIKLIRLKWTIFHIMNAIFIITGLGFSIYLGFEGVIEIGLIAVIYIYLDKIEKRVSDISQIYDSLIRIYEGVSNVSEIYKTEKKEKGINLKNIENIKLENISFSFLTKKILENFNLEINKKDKIVIVGKSGSGKSTLAHLIAKHYENYEGNIYFDGKNIRDIKGSSIFKLIKYIPQDSELFNMTIKENLSLLDSKKERQKDALKLSICDFITNLDKGIDTIISEGSKNISGGEKQRLSLARSFLAGGDVFIYDEITSSLDKKNREKIINNILKFHKNNIVIFITHFDDCLDKFDKVVNIN